MISQRRETFQDALRSLVWTMTGALHSETTPQPHDVPIGEAIEVLREMANELEQSAREKEGGTQPTS